MKLWMAITLLGFLICVGFAQAVTWTSNLPSATSTTEGANQQIGYLRKNVQEIRAYVDSQGASIDANTSRIATAFTNISTAFVYIGLVNTARTDDNNAFRAYTSLHKQ